MWATKAAAVGRRIHPKSIQNTLRTNVASLRISRPVTTLQSMPYYNAISPLNDLHYIQPMKLSTQRVRCFSSRRRNAPNKKKGSNLLSNEKLIKVLMKKSHQTDPTKCFVRLVIDEGPDTPSTVDVVSMADAIDVSLDRDTDLVGMNIDSDPPVIRATQLSKLEYQKEQAQQQQQSSKKKKQQKSFRFRAGIDWHDMERKVKDIIKFLQKGMDIDYSVFSKARVLRENPEAGMELVERIQELLKPYGDLKRPPQKNEQGNFVRVQLEPKKK